jgi:HAD superfamily hydrolase (TIGR01509 family)
MRYQAIIFDFFGVICSEVAPFWLARHFGEAEAVRVKTDIVHLADVGGISEEEMFERLGLITNITPTQIRQEWFELAQIDQKMVSLVRSLRGVVRLGLLTNSPSSFVRSILAIHQLDSVFDAIVVSSETLFTKPDPRIYETMLTCLSVPASATLMIDDNPDNVGGAVRSGIKAILFSSVHQLESEAPELFA